MNPRHSLRKVLGLYEHELNRWLESALPRVTRVLDVGANDGYFTFGTAAAFLRLEIKGEIFSFEPHGPHVQTLRDTVAVQDCTKTRIHIIQALVGREVREGLTTLDALRTSDRTRTLIKIDVEGAELEVLQGAHWWLQPSNLFVIEVHEQRFLAELKQMFAKRGHNLVRIDQRPLPLLGREQRSKSNWWLVSELSQIMQ